MKASLQQINNSVPEKNNFYKQVVVATLLDYGEPQILELFKNTLPSRLYYFCYQVDNLNAVIETAKRILTKEKIDKQKTGQSSATPFIKASQDKSKKSEKGCVFWHIGNNGN